MATRNDRANNAAGTIAALLPALCAGLAACASSLPAQAAKADVAAAPDREAAHSDITFLCSQERSSLILSSDPVDHPKGFEQRNIDLGSLVTYEKEGSSGFARRTGTKTTSSKCGELTVSVQGAFHNADPNGELGAADDYAVATIYRDRTLLLGPVAIGVCSAGNPRYDTHAECPSKWATKVSVYFSPEGKPWIELQHSYDELIRPAL